MLAALPPNHDAGQDDDAGKEQLVEPFEGGSLSGAEVHSTIGGGLGTNGDEVFVGSQPVDGVVEQIAVAKLGQIRVYGELRIADDDDAGIFVAELTGTGNAERERAADVNFRIEGDFVVLRQRRD